MQPERILSWFYLPQDFETEPHTITSMNCMGNLRSPSDNVQSYPMAISSPQQNRGFPSLSNLKVFRMTIRWLRLLPAAIVAEIIPIVILVALVAIFGPGAGAEILLTDGRSADARIIVNWLTGVPLLLEGGAQ